MEHLETFILNLPKNNSIEFSDIYPDSINRIKESYIFMIQHLGEDCLVSVGKIMDHFDGEVFGNDVRFKISKLNHQTGIKIRELLPFTAPTPVLHKSRSFGLGDRLGLAGVGHLSIIKEYDAYPVLAQQSIRELALTQRTYKDVLDAATFSVLKTGYKDGFGADGDHLKNFDEVEMALDLGYTMITLDCSEHIDNSVLSLSDKEVNESVELSDYYKKTYLDKKFQVEEFELSFDEIELKRIVLTYEKAIHFASQVYKRFFDKKDQTANFEISIDETMTPTTPNQHYFVANEMKREKIVADTVAPRFIGEFQKGVDYIGDVAQFEAEFKVHAAIARLFSYKLSIHSGSDKFSIFEIVGKYTKGDFHVKTAGTNWLEAMKIVAIVDPKLYRTIHAFALSRFEDATKYYHVTTDINKIPNLDSMSDEELPSLFEMNDARQLIHITYGFILSETDEFGNYLFKDELYDLWQSSSELYKDSLHKHIGRHLQLLYKGFEKL